LDVLTADDSAESSASWLAILLDANLAGKLVGLKVDAKGTGWAHQSVGWMDVLLAAWLDKLLVGHSGCSKGGM
jgi:hypothetical protein